MEENAMTDLMLPAVTRRSLFATAAASTLLAAAGAREPVHAQAAPPTGGGPGPSAVIDVNRARTDPIPIAIPSFGDGPLGRDIAGVVSADLARSGLFKPISAAASIETVATGDVPNFQNWKAVGAQALVTGRTSGSGSVRVEFRLWDVLPEKQIQGTAYTTSEGNWRRIAHMIADVIYERLLGEKGYFDTRIVYVSATGPRDRRTKRLAIMDQDSANNRFLTDGSWLVLTPRFHPTRPEIAFMSYANSRPRVYLFDLNSGRQQVLGDFSGMTFGPRFSPDGGSVIMYVARGNGSDIVSVDLGSHTARDITSSGSIDVSPCYSPDGSQIVFNSDRGGDQQLYVMSAGGGGARRISFGSGRYATPVWSPRGDLIAFTRFGGGSGNFAIGVMHPDGTGERILSESFAEEGPTFAPNGRVLAFWRGSQLASIDITGFNEQVLRTPTDASAPAWSPLGA